ncbi:MAG: hypothetical protein JNK82_01135, partial [Myxococcaceae bacterium]|nr:hypothetical protein [Myxococcaceae bacterium]
EKKTALIATDPAWATVERFERMLWPGLLLAKAPLRALKQLDRPLSGETWELLSRRAEPLNVERAGVDRPDLDLVAVRRVLPKLDTLYLTGRVVNVGDLTGFLDLDVRCLVANAWWRPGPEFAAAAAAYAKLLDDVEGVLARVAELRLHGPFSKPGAIPPADVFQRDASGRLRRQAQ